MDPKPIIEAILFSSTRPIGRSEILQRLRTFEKEKVEAALEEIVGEYKRPERGVEVVEVLGGYVMRTKPEYGLYIRSFKKGKGSSLSRSMVEVLAIVAYRQPVTKGEIDELRGVDSKRPIRELLRRNLIEMAGRRDGQMVFTTTERFLFTYGLKDIKDLPTIKELDSL
jgi:segregation and condensation protein B